MEITIYGDFESFATKLKSSMEESDRLFEKKTWTVSEVMKEIDYIKIEIIRDLSEKEIRLYESKRKS